MNVLILSDSHGRGNFVDAILTRTHPDAVLFAGDGLRDLLYAPASAPIYTVRGNCDFYVPPMSFANGDAEEESLFYLEEKKVLLMHGHKWGVKSGLGAALAHAARLEADILVFGHTHEPFERYYAPDDTHGEIGLPLRKPLWVFNPGSLGDRPHTFGTLTIRKGQLLFGHGTV